MACMLPLVVSLACLALCLQSSQRRVSMWEPYVGDLGVMQCGGGCKEEFVMPSV